MSSVEEYRSYNLRRSAVKLVGASLLATVGIFLTKAAIDSSPTNSEICTDLNHSSCKMVMQTTNEYLTAIEHPIFTVSSLVLAGIGTITTNIQLGKTINLLSEKKPTKTQANIKNLYPQKYSEKSKIA